MSLISCPECGKEISDKAENCIHCGYPISKSEEKKVISDCIYCKSKINAGDDYCDSCGMRVTPYSSPSEKVEFESKCENDTDEIGVYRTNIFGGNEKVCCPRCGSSNCSIYFENHTIPVKVKTSYSANLNPLKPLTLLNKKEKVVRKERDYTIQKYACNKCGKIFY